MVSEVLTVYHIGKHMCVPKQKMKKYKGWVREAVVRKSSIGACDIQQAEVGKAIEASNISDTWGRALQLYHRQGPKSPV